MSNIKQTRISLRKGLKSDLPSHAPLGEPLYCTDTGEMYVGMGQNEKPKDLLENLKTFTRFPTEQELLEIPINSIFEVKSINTNGDMDKCMYVKRGWANNSVKVGTQYITPLTRCTTGSVFLPYLGILPGKEHSVNNSKIIESVVFKFGSVLELPSGHYYFDRPLDLQKLQLSLKGSIMSFTTDTNTSGLTWLHFENLKEGESAIKIATGSIYDVKIVGNSKNYSYKIDRTNTYTNKNNIESETSKLKCYGITGGSVSSLVNVEVRNFYYGCKLNTGNIYINNFYCRECHYGLSIGNDTKVTGVFGWNVHTLLQIRGSISSAIQVRGDSIHHLVELIGYMSGIHLSDLDADYCLGNILKIGTTREWGSVSHLYVSGIRGRCCVLNCYDTTQEEPPTSDTIKYSDDVPNWGIIGVCSYNSIRGAIISLNSNISTNPMDGESNYKTPNIIMSVGERSQVRGVNVSMSLDDDTTLNKQYFVNNLKSFSENASNINMSFYTSQGTFYVDKNGVSPLSVSKTSIQVL